MEANLVIKFFIGAVIVAACCSFRRCCHSFAHSLAAANPWTPASLRVRPVYSRRVSKAVNLRRVSIAALTSLRTNLSPFTKGCRDRGATMRILNFLIVDSAS